MVVVSLLPHDEFGPNYHWKEAPYFTLIVFHMQHMCIQLWWCQNISNNRFVNQSLWLNFLVNFFSTDSLSDKKRNFDVRQKWSKMTSEVMRSQVMTSLMMERGWMEHWGCNGWSEINHFVTSWLFLLIHWCKPSMVAQLSWQICHSLTGYDKVRYYESYDMTSQLDQM